jgi:hypothetical protein
MRDGARRSPSPSAVPSPLRTGCWPRRLGLATRLGSSDPEHLCPHRKHGHEQRDRSQRQCFLGSRANHVILPSCLERIGNIVHLLFSESSRGSGSVSIVARTVNELSVVCNVHQHERGQCTAYERPAKSADESPDKVIRRCHAGINGTYASGSAEYRDAQLFIQRARKCVFSHFSNCSLPVKPSGRLVSNPSLRLAFAQEAINPLYRGADIEPAADPPSLDFEVYFRLALPLGFERVQHVHNIGQFPKPIRDTCGHWRKAATTRAASRLENAD